MDAGMTCDKRALLAGRIGLSASHAPMVTPDEGPDHRPFVVWPAPASTVGPRIDLSRREYRSLSDSQSGGARCPADRLPKAST